MTTVKPFGGNWGGVSDIGGELYGSNPSSVGPKDGGNSDNAVKVHQLTGGRRKKRKTRTARISKTRTKISGGKKRSKKRKSRKSRKNKKNTIIM